MRIGIHCFAYNMGPESPVRRLFDTLVNRGHEIVFLDTDNAAREGETITFPNLPSGSKVDMFLSYLPSSDLNILLHGAEDQDVSYYDQLKWLSAHFPSPTPYESHLITKDKVAMAQSFIKHGLPMPASYDGANSSARQTVLSAINEGQTIVFKPSFGGSGAGVTKTSSVEEARAIMDEYDQSGENFMMQEFVQNPRLGNQTLDYRALVVGDRVIAGIQRTAQPGEWRTNNSLGSKNTAHQFTHEQEADAIKALQIANLGFGAVDIMIDARTGKHYICELNDGMDMSHLDKARPDLDLPSIIARMFEEKYGTEDKDSENKQRFMSAHNKAAPEAALPPAPSVPNANAPKDTNPQQPKPIASDTPRSLSLLT